MIFISKLLSFEATASKALGEQNMYDEGEEVKGKISFSHYTLIYYSINCRALIGNLVWRTAVHEI